MAKIPKINKVKIALEDYDVLNNPRTYLGYSKIGEKCIRKLQYDLRLAYTTSISRRIKRLFNVGHYMERVFIDDLLRIGIIVERRQEEIIGFAGHWKGHIDGTAMGVTGAEKTEHLVEFKTHNDKSFQQLLKFEEVKKSHRGHYDQFTMYMGKLKLTRCLYLGYNKNDSDYYVERIYFNQDDYDELCHKEKSILFYDGLAPRIGTGQPTWHECKFCDAFYVCFNKETITKNCRNCEFVGLEDEGRWRCNKHKVTLNISDQYAACDDYQLEEILNAGQR